MLSIAIASMIASSGKSIIHAIFTTYIGRIKKAYFKSVISQEIGYFDIKKAGA
jgi:hypothetical protein